MGRAPAEPGALVDAGAREHYADAALYDYEYRRRRADVGYYVALAAQLGAARVLDLGAGSGRVALPLVRAGHQVVAVDAAAPMRARLAERIADRPATEQRRLRVVEGDLRELGALDVGARFPLVIAAFNVVEHLYTRVELAAMLAGVARHLAPGGTFAFDVQLPDARWLARRPDKRWGRTTFTHPATGARWIYSTSHVYEPVSQIALIRLFYRPVATGEGSRRERVVHLSQRKYFPAELEALVAAAGFAAYRRHGDFAGGPLTGEAQQQVLLCCRAEDRRAVLEGQGTVDGQPIVDGEISPSPRKRR